MNVSSEPTVFDHPEFDDHEQVVFCRDLRSGLEAIIAIHDTTLGPALGGCRMWPYATSAEALTDVLRLSRGMTFKNALAGLDFGGGKAVVIADPTVRKPRALLEAFGTHVDHLGGRYLTAEDVGMTTADLDVIATKTSHATGTSVGGLGDPSPYTALGVFHGIRAALAHRFGSDDPAGRRVVVQGVGHVGLALTRMLADAGAQLFVSDIHESHLAQVKEVCAAEIVPVATAHRVEADVYAPCALGAVLSETTIPELGAPIIAGAANNQLATDEDAERLHGRGILYAPDYVINAGGVISIAFAGSAEGAREARQKTEAIGATLARIFRRADEEDRPTAIVADQIALERLAEAGSSRAKRRRSGLSGTPRE